MNELNKIKEAEYFYYKMVESKENNEIFRFNLSAFLSSSRSALQYTLEEARIKKGGQGWYDSQVSKNRAVSFLKDKRDVNIHETPVSTKKDISLKLSETIHIGESVTMVVQDKNGNIKSQSNSEFKPFKSTIEKGLVSIKYTFEDWSGNEDIFDICTDYLKELNRIVKDGRNKGFLT